MITINMALSLRCACSGLPWVVSEAHWLLFLLPRCENSTNHKERNFLTFFGQLGALAISAALERAGCPKEAVDEVYMGAVLQVH